MADKMTRKELRAPDAFQKVGGEASSWLADHAGKVVVGVVVVVLLGAGVAIASYVSDRNDARAAQQLGQALEVLDRPVQAAGPNFDAAPDAKPPFKSQTEKDEAVVKALSDFRAANKGSRSAVTAALPLAQAQSRLGKQDDALASYKDFLSKVDANDPLRAAGLEGQGYAYEAKGQLDQALESYRELAKLEKTEFMQGMGLFHQGRVLELQGKKDEAAKTFSELRAKYPSSTAATAAQDRLTALGSQGVKIPEAPPAAPTDATTAAPKG